MIETTRRIVRRNVDIDQPCFHIRYLNIRLPQAYSAGTYRFYFRSLQDDPSLEGIVQEIIVGCFPIRSDVLRSGLLHNPPGEVSFKY